MTINVAVKCPDGIVMGADSLVTIIQENIVSTIIPYYSKLFPIGRLEDHDKCYAAGAMINGDGNVAGRTVQDILEEFGELYSTKQGIRIHRKQDINNYSLYQLVKDLGDEIQHLVHKENSKVPNLEIIIGGYSKGKKSYGKRYGEMYSIFWNAEDVRANSGYRLKVLYNEDTEFGTYYGGQPMILDRFKFGIDDWMIAELYNRRGKLFNQIREYIFSKLLVVNTSFCLFSFFTWSVV